VSAKLPPGITEWTPHPTTGKPRWLVRWREPSGKPRKRVFDRLTDARNHLTNVTADRHRGTYVDDRAGRQLFGDFAEEWAAVQQWKQSTRDGWPATAKRLAPYLGGLRLADVDRLELEKTRNALAEKGYERRTVEDTMLRARRIMRYAHECGRLGRDVTVGFDPEPKRRADDRDRAVTADMVPTRAEALAILASAPTAWRASVALGLAGLRLGEMLGMRTDRLQLDQRLVTVDVQASQLRGQGVVLTTPKAEKVRTIRVPPLVAVELRRHLRDGRAGAWTDADDTAHEMLFRWPNGNLLRREQYYAAAWVPALKAAGLAGRFTPHSLRHFCASTLLAEGAASTQVAGHLGDTVTTVQQTYAHWLRDDRDVPADILDRVLAPEADAPPARHGVAGDAR
jgi:integrase